MSYKKWGITDIKEVLKEVGSKMQLDAQGIPIEISNRMIKAKGQYTFKTKTFTPVGFKFASILLDGNYPATTVKETIIHEYIHFYTNTLYKNNCGHNYQFKANCRRAGISDETYFTEESETVNNMMELNAKYIIQCTECGKKIYKSKTCKVVEHPENFLCGKCRGKLERIK